MFQLSNENFVKLAPAKVKYGKDVQYKMFVRNSVLFCFVFLTDKNDRSSQPSEKSGCGSGDGRKRRYVGINRSSRDVRSLRIIFEI